MGMRAALIGLAAMLAAGGAEAATLDAKAGQAIVAGCAAHSAGKGQSQAIAVVDLGGKPVATLRMDGNGWGIADLALAKAQASAAYGFTTGQLGEAARTAVPGFERAPHVVTVQGGVPVWDATGRERIGAVGASGEAPADDEACARAGIAAAGLRAERAPR